MTYLYRHFNEKGDLLYVGVSLSVTYRLSQHKQSSEWFKEIARVEIEKFQTREEALDGERRAISEEKPKHNKMRPAVTPIKVEPLKQNELSRDDLMKRIVQFNPTYSLEEAGSALGVGNTTIKKWIKEKKLGYIVIGYSSGRWGTSEKRRITGWQLIDFIEYLEKVKEA
jgi:predicted GIY-YIG superfamily endonuclease